MDDNIATDEDIYIDFFVGDTGNFSSSKLTSNQTTNNISVTSVTHEQRRNTIICFVILFIILFILTLGLKSLF